MATACAPLGACPLMENRPDNPRPHHDATVFPAIKGLHFNPRTRALHVRLDNPNSLRAIIPFFSCNHSSHAEYRNLLESVVSLYLAIGEQFLMPHQQQQQPNNNNNDNNNEEHQQPTAENAAMMQQFCEAACQGLPNVTEIHMSRALAGFLHHNADDGAWCPVQAIAALLLQKATNSNASKLETLMLRNLRIYSSLLGDATTSPVQLLANALSGHSSLRRFGWQQCELVPTVVEHQIGGSDTSAALDPLLKSLATLPKLTDCVVQCPHWQHSLMPTSNQAMKTLGNIPTLTGLHLDGLHLQNDNLQSLLLNSKNRNGSALLNLSLSLHLTLDTIQDLAISLGQILVAHRSGLEQLSLRLDWLDDGNTNGKNEEHQRRQRLKALQSFQDTIGRSLLPGNDNPYDYHTTDIPQQRLHRLELIYYDDVHNPGATATPTGSNVAAYDNNDATCPEIFCQALQGNFTLTHLRLPFCGEMHPTIAFLLKLNRMGLRQQLFLGGCTSDDIDTKIGNTTTPKNPRADGIAALRKVQERPEQCWIPASGATAASLSMIYYLLQELPCMFR